MRIKFGKRVKKDIFNKLLDNIFGQEEKLSYFCNVINTGLADLPQAHDDMQQASQSSGYEQNLCTR